MLLYRICRFGVPVPPTPLRHLRPTRLKVRERYAVSDEEMYKSRAMASDTMKVRFGSPFDPFDLWIWIEFETGPASEDQQMYLEELLKAWFIVGRMGGYNSINLQARRLDAPCRPLSECS